MVVLAKKEGLVSNGTNLKLFRKIDSGTYISIYTVLGWVAVVPVPIEHPIKYKIFLLPDRQ